MEELIIELKSKIIKTLEFEDISPDNIDPDAPLVGGDLGIDSIDILELVMMIEKDYNIKIDNKDLGKKVFYSLKALAGYIHEHREYQ